MEAGSEGEERARRRHLRLIPGDPSCSFCGDPDGRPLHGVRDIAVCEECLHYACLEMLYEGNGVRTT